MKNGGITLESARRDTAQPREVSRFVHMTGPESYDYIFGKGPALDALIDRAWPATGNFYAHDVATLALDGSGVAGIEIGYPGNEFYARREALTPLAIDAVEAGDISQAELAGIVERADKTSYLNAHVPDDVYYLMALAVPPERRGQGIGKSLLAHAIERARDKGFRALHLDVLSNNPAIGLYRAMGLECVAEIVAPEPHANGVPMEMRMAIDF